MKFVDENKTTNRTNINMTDPQRYYTYLGSWQVTNIRQGRLASHCISSPGRSQTNVLVQ